MHSGFFLDEDVSDDNNLDNVSYADNESTHHADTMPSLSRELPSFTDSFEPTSSLPKPERKALERSSANRRLAAARRSNAGTTGRRGSVSIRSAEDTIKEKKGPNVNSVLTDVMKAYMSLELELADEAQVFQLAKALHVNTSVTSINLSYNKSIADAGLKSLGEALTQNVTLVALNLSGCTSISDAAAALMLANLDKVFSLKSLVLSGCPLVGDQFAAQLAESMDVEDHAEHESRKSRLQLRDVSLSGCRALTDEGAVDVGRALQNSVALKTLNLQGCVLLTDRSVSALAEGLRFSPALETLDLSWCEELTDESAVALSGALCENRFLTSLLLSCCVKMTDASAKALAAGIERNQTLTTLDLSWIVKLGEPALAALTQSMFKNCHITTLNLTGCKCMKQLLDLQNGVPAGAPAAASTTDRPAGAPPVSQQRRQSRSDSVVSVSADRVRARAYTGSSLPALLQRNRSRPTAPKTLAGSALGGSDNGGFTPGQPSYGRRGLITTPVELLRTLRATIINGAALYNAEDAEGCFKLFMQTAESIMASTRSPAVAEALLKVTSMYAPREMPQRLWLLRTAFDDLVDDLVEQEEKAQEV